MEIGIKKTTDMGHPEANMLWTFTLLSEPTLSSELERLSFAKSEGDTDVVSFQPCPNPEESNQDRYVIEDWALPNGRWTFRAVLDGHAGHDTVDYTASELPNAVKHALNELLLSGGDYAAGDVTNALSESISQFDHDIGQALLDLFPDQDTLAQLSDEEIKGIINDNGPNSKTVLRCMRGSTVLISITDPGNSNIWVASLGDCAGILGTKEPSSNEWKPIILSSFHNGENPVEENKIKTEHPGEDGCHFDARVLGAIAVTRAMGDFEFKLPAIYTNRVFLNSEPGFRIASKVRDFIRRNLTPPYMTGIPDIRHVDLKAIGATKAFLIMCSDGLIDLFGHFWLKLSVELSNKWVTLVGKNYQEKNNLALKLLREGIGADNEEEVSRNITVEMTERWMDDTTVLIQRL